MKRVGLKVTSHLQLIIESFQIKGCVGKSPSTVLCTRWLYFLIGFCLLLNSTSFVLEDVLLSPFSLGGPTTSPSL